jgi:hypothetical protein
MKKLMAIVLSAAALPILPVSPARSQAQAIPAAVAACSANPAVCAVVVGAAGWILYYRDRPPLLCTWNGCRVQRMMQDPEATESTTEEYVWADNEASARRMCERTAQRNGWRLDDVQLAGSIALQTGKKRFTCRWTMFGSPRY